MVSAVEPGRLVVLSSLGEPLRAEIDFVQPAGQRAVPVMHLAPAEAYAAAGLRYDPALAAARLRFDIRPDGRPFYTLQSARAIQATSLALLFEIEAPPPRRTRGYQLLLDPQIAAGSTQFYPAVLVSRAPVARSAASAPAAAIPEREIARLQSQLDAQGRSLAAMLERVAAMEKTVKELQRQLGAPAATPVVKPAPEPIAKPAVEQSAVQQPAAEKPAAEQQQSAAAPAPAPPAAPAPAPKPSAVPPPAKTPSAAAAELAERQARSDSWLNHSLLILAGGLLVMLIGIGGWMFYGPPSREAGKVKADKKAGKADKAAAQ